MLKVKRRVDLEEDVNDEEGRWITVKGAKIFIPKGTSMSKAVGRFLKDKESESTNKDEGPIDKKAEKKKEKAILKLMETGYDRKSAENIIGKTRKKESKEEPNKFQAKSSNDKKIEKKKEELKKHVDTLTKLSNNAPNMIKGVIEILIDIMLQGAKSGNINTQSIKRFGLHYAKIQNHKKLDKEKKATIMKEISSIKNELDQMADFNTIGKKLNFDIVNIFPDFILDLFLDLEGDLQVEVPGYSYTTGRGTVVNVPAYSYERKGSSATSTTSGTTSTSTSGESKRVEVPAYSYTNNRGTLVNVPGYSYIRGSGGKKSDKQPLPPKEPKKESKWKIKQEGNYTGGKVITRDDDRKPGDPEKTYFNIYAYDDKGKQIGRANFYGTTWTDPKDGVKKNILYLGMLKIRHGFRGQGVASEMLANGLNLVDKNNVIVVGMAIPIDRDEWADDDDDARRLQAFYKRFGGELVVGEREGQMSAYMVRYPKKYTGDVIGIPQEIELHLDRMEEIGGNIYYVDLEGQLFKLSFEEEEIENDDMFPDFILDLFLDLEGDLQVEVPGYSYINNKGTTVNVPAYSYERKGSSAPSTTSGTKSTSTSGESKRVEVPAYSYTNNRGTLVNVPGYSYIRGSEGKKSDKQPLPPKEPKKESKWKIEMEGNYKGGKIIPQDNDDDINHYFSIYAYNDKGNKIGYAHFYGKNWIDPKDGVKKTVMDLGMLSINRKYRSKGVASEMLTSGLDFIDKHNIIVIGMAVPIDREEWTDSSENARRLQAFYKRYGGELVIGQRKGKFSAYMVRYPKVYTGDVVNVPIEMELHLDRMEEIGGNIYYVDLEGQLFKLAFEGEDNE